MSGVSPFVKGDHDLYHILLKATDDELALLAKIISEKISSDITEDCRSPELITSEIQLMGGNSIINLFRSHGVCYREIALDVAKKVKAQDIEDSDTIDNIEWKILSKMFSNIEDKLSNSQKDELYYSVKAAYGSTVFGDTIPQAFLNATKDSLKLNATCNPYAYMIILELILPPLLRSLGIQVVTQFFASRLVTTFIPVVGWFLAITSGFFTLASTAYSVTIPIVAIVGGIRARLKAESCAADIMGG